MQVQELVGIIPWTFVAQICNLFIQMYLIKRFLFKPVHEILEKRRAAADAEIIQAEETKAKAEAIRAEYERNMQDARQKANEILDSARNTAAIQSEKILKEAQDQTAHKIADIAYQPYLTGFFPGYFLVNGAESHNKIVSGKQLAAYHRNQKNCNGKHHRTEKFAPGRKLCPRKYIAHYI